MWHSLSSMFGNQDNNNANNNQNTNQNAGQPLNAGATPPMTPDQLRKLRLQQFEKLKSNTPINSGANTSNNNNNGGSAESSSSSTTNGNITSPTNNNDVSSSSLSTTTTKAIDNTNTPVRTNNTNTNDRDIDMRGSSKPTTPLLPPVTPTHTNTSNTNTTKTPVIDARNTTKTPSSAMSMSNGKTPAIPSSTPTPITPNRIPVTTTIKLMENITIPNLIQRVLCLANIEKIPFGLVEKNISEIIDYRMQQCIDSIQDVDVGSPLVGPLVQVSLAVRKMAVTLSGLDFCIFVYNHAAYIAENLGGNNTVFIQGPTGDVTISKSTYFNTSVSTRQKLTQQNDEKIRLLDVLQEQAARYAALILTSEDYYPDIPRIYRSTIDNNVPVFRVTQTNNPIHEINTNDNASSIEYKSPLWSLILGVTDILTSTRLSSTSGSVDILTSATLSSLQDIVTFMCENDEENVLNTVEMISWTILKGSRNTRQLFSDERTYILSVLKTIASCKALARIFMTTPAFTGHYESKKYSIVSTMKTDFTAFPAIYKYDNQMPGNRTMQETQRQMEMVRMFQIQGRFPGAASSSTTNNNSNNNEVKLSGPHLETGTILGNLLSPTSLCPPLVLPREIANRNGGRQSFSVPSAVYHLFQAIPAKTITRVAVDDAIASIRTTIRMLISSIFETWMLFVKVDKEPVLRWFSDVLSANSDRAKDVWQAAEVSSDGFMLNLGHLLCQFCEPITLGKNPIMVNPKYSYNKLLSSHQTSGSSSSNGGEMSPRPLQDTNNNNNNMNSPPSSPVRMTTTLLPVSSTTTSNTGSADKTDRISLIDPTYMLLDAPSFDTSGDRLVTQSSNSNNNSNITPTTPRTPITTTTNDIHMTVTDSTTTTTGFNTNKITSSTTTNTKKEVDYSFITRIFFYTMRALELGLGQSLRDIKQEQRMLGFLDHRIRRGESQLQDRFDYSLINRYCCDSARLDPVMLSKVLKVCTIASEWMARVCTCTDSNIVTNNDTALPFPPNPSIYSKKIPSSFISTIMLTLDQIGSLVDTSNNNIAESVITLAATSEDATYSNDSSTIGFVTSAPRYLYIILHFLLALLSSSRTYIRSPHVRAQIGDALYSVFLPYDAKPQHEDGNDSLYRNTSTNPMSQCLIVPSRFGAEILAPSLMQLYGDVEATGIYDKMEHRKHIAAILIYLWSLKSHRQAFHSIIHHNDGEAFTSFANGIIGHTTSALTDALKGLPIIRDTLRSMADSMTWNQQNEETRTSRETQLQESINLVKSSLLLTNQTTSLLALLTADNDIAQAFMRGELIGRLSAMLIVTAESLGGPRGVDLKVDNPERYNFKPVLLLKDILTTTLHLARHSQFITAVANNGTFKSNEFHKVLQVATRIQLFPQVYNRNNNMNNGDESMGMMMNNSTDSSTTTYPHVTLQALSKFIEEVVLVQESALEEDEILADPPDDFVDPILTILMRDPVKLPSGYIVDRTCILQHIMGNPTDPFTRQPLTVDMLVPQPDLKEKIDQWISDRKKAALEKRNNTINNNNAITQDNGNDDL